MIGWIRGRLETLVLTPQATVPLAIYRATLDPTSSPIGVDYAELDMIGLSTRPIAFEIGGGLALEHTFDVALAVTHGDPVQARQIRDRIVLDLTLRLLDQLPVLLTGSDPDSGQYPTKITTTISYVPLIPDTPNEFARLSIIVETQLDR